MNSATYRITLDIHEAHSGVVLDVKRDDTARKIVITLSESGHPYQIAAECYAVFTATKPDGTIVFRHCEVEGNTIIYDVTKQTIAVEGLVECEIQLYGSDDGLITSPRFDISVSETVYEEWDGIESEDDVDALTHLISEAATAINNANEAAEEARKAVSDVEGSHEDLKALVEEANEAAATAEKIANEMDEAQYTQRLGTLEDTVADMLYKPIDVTSVTLRPSFAEIGSVVNDVEVEWVTNKTPVSQSVNGESVSPDLRRLELHSLGLKNSKSFNVTAKDERGEEDSLTVMLQFANGVYYGALDEDAEINSETIRTLTRSLQIYRTKTFAVTAAEGQRFTYALPSRYGTPLFNIGGFDYVWTKVSTFDYTNDSGYTEKYDVWMNDEVVVGTRTIKVT